MGKGKSNFGNISGSGKGPAPYSTNSIHLAACKARILILSNIDLIEILSQEKNMVSVSLASTTRLQTYESLIATKPYQSFFTAW